MDSWTKYNKELLKRIVDTDDLVRSYQPEIAIKVLGGNRTSLPEKIEKFHSDVSHRIRNLRSILDRLELIPEAPELKQATPKQQPSKPRVSSRRVFIVHGHDETAKQSVARLLEKLDLEPIILHEQPNQGRTIIEKFEDYSDVGFAVALITPDDVGAAKEDAERPKPRARQNVLFELGFFFGKLGRKKVCALHKGNVEILSDFSGVLWVPMDKGGAWHLKLGKEIKAAGLDVDLNKLV
ncbi:nucleotide-binding protein [Candidatus Bipolaricaulota bacterium]|nr:nucleotide-binding protein [Candidatus Bipolaricaulota bacterium]